MQTFCIEVALLLSALLGIDLPFETFGGQNGSHLGICGPEILSVLVGGTDLGGGCGAIAKNTAQLDVITFQTFCQCVEICQSLFIGQSG